MSERTGSRLVLLAAAVVQHANATVGARGDVHARAEARTPVTSRRKRLQHANAIYSASVPGFEPLQQPWTTVRAPHKQLRPGEHGPRQHVFEFDIESSRNPGTFTRVHVQYLQRGAKACRSAARRLTETNRAVRVDDGGCGWMVGAGHHLSYAGLIEYFKPKAAGACSPAGTRTS